VKVSKQGSISYGLWLLPKKYLFEETKSQAEMRQKLNDIPTDMVTNDIDFANVLRLIVAFSNYWLKYCNYIKIVVFFIC
jgi:hypothetical protein